MVGLVLVELLYSNSTIVVELKEVNFSVAPGLWAFYGGRRPHMVPQTDARDYGVASARNMVNVLGCGGDAAYRPFPLPLLRARVTQLDRY